MNNAELCLGTVQFGMDYGISSHGRVHPSEALQCIETAIDCGIRSFDTAASYGQAEQILGSYLARSSSLRESLRITSKTPVGALNGARESEYARILNSLLDITLRQLNTEYLDYFLFHESCYSKNQAALEAIDALRSSGKVLFTGVSIYDPEEAEACAKSQVVNVIQAPVSIFDQRMILSGKLKSEHFKCVQARSIFIQGLLLMPVNSIPSYLSEITPFVLTYIALCEKYGVSRLQAALAFVRGQASVAQLVVGAENPDQILQLAEAFRAHISEELNQEILLLFSNISDTLVLPTKWRETK